MHISWLARAEHFIPVESPYEKENSGTSSPSAFHPSLGPRQGPLPLWTKVGDGRCWLRHVRSSEGREQNRNGSLSFLWRSDSRCQSMSGAQRSSAPTPTCSKQVGLTFSFLRKPNQQSRGFKYCLLNSTSYHENLSIFLAGLDDQKVSCDYSCGQELRQTNLCYPKPTRWHCHSQWDRVRTWGL